VTSRSKSQSSFYNYQNMVCRHQNDCGKKKISRLKSREVCEPKIIRKAPKKLSLAEVTSFQSQHQVSNDDFKKIANFYRGYSKTFIDTDCHSVDKVTKIHQEALKQRTNRISIEINSPGSGHSTDSNSPDFRQMKAPRKIRRMLNRDSMVINIKKCEKRNSNSPFEDQRLKSLGIN
jgi:hypothetical protein